MTSFFNKETANVRIAAVGDIHYGRDVEHDLKPLFSSMNRDADIILLCGDLTNYGLPGEAEGLAQDLRASIKKPIVAVLGNHDYESGKAAAVTEILRNIGVHVLNGQSIEILGIGFAGTKGFGGGFGNHALQAWGEESIKNYVRDSREEAMKLESALTKLQTEQKIVVLHYSPIEETVRGEALEIYPFLGSSRLEVPIDEYHVRAVFHGHAHHGSPTGKTQSGIPVFNVALPMLAKLNPDQPAYRSFEIKHETKTAVTS